VVYLWFMTDDTECKTGDPYHDNYNEGRDDWVRDEREAVSDTPRTDKVWEDHFRGVFDTGYTRAETMLQHARKLERELATTKEELTKSCCREWAAAEDYKHMRVERDDALLELAAVTEQRDRLAEALEDRTSIAVTIKENYDKMCALAHQLARGREELRIQRDRLESCLARLRTRDWFTDDTINGEVTCGLNADQVREALAAVEGNQANDDVEARRK
jgi:hypothetical protein